MSNLELVLRDQNPWWQSTLQHPALPGLAGREVGTQLLRALIDPRSEQRGRVACVLLGMRQVGKTTLLLQLVEQLLQRKTPPHEVVYFDFSDSRIVGKAPRPDEVLALVPKSKTDTARPLFVLFDEITKAFGKEQEQLGVWVKTTVDRVRQARSHDLRLVMTDSAASLLALRSTKESAFGRTQEFTLLGFSLSEFLQVRAPNQLPERAVRENPDHLDEYLEYGGLPAAVYGRLAQRSYLKELREGIISKVAQVDLAVLGQDTLQLSKLLAHLMAHSGELFQRENLHDVFDADKRSLERWTETLLNTGLFFRVPRDGSHRLKPKARARVVPKIHASEHGLVQAFALQHHERESSLGKVYEAVVLRHLRELSLEVFYARDQNGPEVDFVVEHAARRIGIEVTSSDSLKGKWGPGQNIKKHFALDRLVFVHGGTDQRDEDGLWSVPLPSFLLDPKRVLG